MLDYNLDISADSEWVISTQPPAARAMPFFLTEAGHFRAGGAYHTARSDREGFYLLYTVSGEGLVELEGSSFPLPPGHAVLLCCQPPHRYAALPGGWDNHWVHLDGAGIGPYFERAADTPVPLRDPAAFEELFGLLPGLAAREDIPGLARISHTLSGLLTALLLSRMEVGQEQFSSHRRDIRRAVDYIREHYRQPISVDDITAALNISKFHFVRLFQRQMGVTPYRYLIQHRINQAKLLLATGDLPVAQVAAAVGYASESNFIRQFRELSGMTPLQYRRSNRSYGI